MLASRVVEVNQIMLMNCPECEAIFMLRGDFLENEGQIIRACDIPHWECQKCSAINEIVGFSEGVE